jgi:hypothetical protein
MTKKLKVLSMNASGLNPYEESKMKILSAHTVYADNISDFDEEVNEFIHAGFQPHGQIFVEPVLKNFCLLMVKPE